MIAGVRSTPQPRLQPGLTALLLIAAVGFSGPAAAQSTNLHGLIGTTYLPPSQQSWPNVALASLTGMTAHDPYGNDGIAHGSLAILNGRASASPHACSGGGPGFGGQATAAADVANILDYKVISATLPVGSPVAVELDWAFCSRVTAVGKDMVGSNTSATSAASFQFAAAPNFVLVINKNGSISRTFNTSGQQKLTSGNANAESDSSRRIFNMQVGQIIRLTINFNASGNSSVEQGQTDADAQASAVWGLTSLDPAATVVWTGDTSVLAPPASGGTLADAYLALPPKAGSLPCFQFALQPEDVTLCGTTDAGFSVGLTGGGGPYTYQWRKDGVPIDLQTNPTAQSDHLIMSNVSTGDAGSYDVVVTDHCGTIVSNPGTLAVCATGVGDVPVGTRLAPARPAPFRTSTTLGFDLAVAGDATLEIFDARGAHVRTLASGWQHAGRTDVTWSGDDESGRRVPAGVYMVRLVAGAFTGTQRVVRMP